MAKRKRWTKAKRKAFSVQMKRYNRYKAKYFAQKRKMESQGREMYDNEVLDFRDWKMNYNKKRKELLKEVEAGKRASVGNVNSQLVMDQSYSITSAQARAILGWLKKSGTDYDTSNINEFMYRIRQEEFYENLDIWEEIRQFRKDMFASGMDAEQVRNEVASTFFGSK